MKHTGRDRVNTGTTRHCFSKPQACVLWKKKTQNYFSDNNFTCWVGTAWSYLPALSHLIITTIPFYSWGNGGKERFSHLPKFWVWFKSLWSSTLNGRKEGKKGGRKGGTEKGREEGCMGSRERELKGEKEKRKGKKEKGRRDGKEKRKRNETIQRSAFRIVLFRLVAGISLIGTSLEKPLFSIWENSSSLYDMHIKSPVRSFPPLYFQPVDLCVPCSISGSNVTIQGWQS